MLISDEGGMEEEERIGEAIVMLKSWLFSIFFFKFLSFFFSPFFSVFLLFGCGLA